MDNGEGLYHLPGRIAPPLTFEALRILRAAERAILAEQDMTSPLPPQPTTADTPMQPSPPTLTRPAQLAPVTTVPMLDAAPPLPLHPFPSLPSCTRRRPPLPRRPPLRGRRTIRWQHRHRQLTPAAPSSRRHPGCEMDLEERKETAAPHPTCAEPSQAAPTSPAAVLAAIEPPAAAQRSRCLPPCSADLQRQIYALRAQQRDEAMRAAVMQSGYNYRGRMEHAQPPRRPWPADAGRRRG